MQLIKKNLKTVKNKLLVEMQDVMFDAKMTAMSSGVVGEINREQLLLDIMTSLLDKIRDNEGRFAVICYTDEEGKELSLSDLYEEQEYIEDNEIVKKLTIKFNMKERIMEECIEDIMEIATGSDGKEEGEVEGKLKPRKRASARKK